MMGMSGTDGFAVSLEQRGCHLFLAAWQRTDRAKSALPSGRRLEEVGARLVREAGQ